MRFFVASLSQNDKLPAIVALFNPTYTIIEWQYSNFHRYVKQGTYDSDWEAGTEIKFDVKVGHE